MGAAVALPTASHHWLGGACRVSESRVVVANAVARSQIFSSQPKQLAKRVFATPERLASWGACEIWQLGGPQLNQADESAWLLAVRWALPLQMADGQSEVVVECEELALMTALEMPNTAQYRKSLRESMDSLTAATFKIILGANDDNAFAGSLLRYSRSRRGGRIYYRITLHLEMAKFFLAGWSYMSFKHRLALRGNPLAQWLLTHYSTHQVPVAITHTKLQVLADRARMREDKWLASLTDALAALSTVTGWVCRLDSTGLVSVQRKPRPEKAPIGVALDPADSILLDAWLASLDEEALSRQESLLMRRLLSLGFTWTPRTINFLTLREQRESLRTLLLCNPYYLNKRLARLREAPEDI